uniref:Uncharacterized protein n=1 Tax=Arundo donax TaxID=35708 RepID=A0A0A8ZYP0_ARUDO
MMANLSKNIIQCHFLEFGVCSNYYGQGKFPHGEGSQQSLHHLVITPIFATICSNLVNQFHQLSVHLLWSFIILHHKSTQLSF